MEVHGLTLTGSVQNLIFAYYSTTARVKNESHHDHESSDLKLLGGWASDQCCESHTMVK